MSLFHVSIEAEEPDRVARVLARIMDGPCLPFPPAPGAWMAFAAADDGTAVEVYPAGTRVEKGAEAIRFDAGGALGTSASHVALASPLSEAEILDIGAREGWTARRCNRGPFDCVELWIEDRLLIEVLDPDMQRNYRRNMTATAWRGMFGMEE